MRSEILKLRNDPTANAADGRRLHQGQCRCIWRRSSAAQPSEGELYIAHFLGAGGAARLISLAASNPNAKRPRLFPERRARQFLDLLRSGDRPRRAASPRCATFSPRATTSPATMRCARAHAASAAGATVAPGTLSVARRHRRAFAISPPLRLRLPLPRRAARLPRPRRDRSGGARYGRHDRRLRRGNADAGRAGGEPDVPRPVPGSRPHRAGRRRGQPAAGPRRTAADRIGANAAQPIAAAADRCAIVVQRSRRAVLTFRQQSQTFMVNALLSAAGLGSPLQ